MGEIALISKGHKGAGMRNIIERNSILTEPDNVMSDSIQYTVDHTPETRMTVERDEQRGYTTDPWICQMELYGRNGNDAEKINVLVKRTLDTAPMPFEKRTTAETLRRAAAYLLKLADEIEKK